MADSVNVSVPQMGIDSPILQFLETYLGAYRLSSSSLIWIYIMYGFIVITVGILAVRRQKKMAWERHRLRAGVTFDHSALQQDGLRTNYDEITSEKAIRSLDRATWLSRMRAKWSIPRPRPRAFAATGWSSRFRVAFACSMPPRGQLILVMLFLIVTLLLTFVGPDAINQNRQALQALTDALNPVSYESDGEGLVLGGAYTSPQIVRGALVPGNVDKKWWTIGNRSGIMAFANMPLLMLLVVRTPGVNVIQLVGRTRSLDLNTCHRWVGRLILVLSTVHVVMWSIKASGDQVLRYGLSPTDNQGIVITGQTRIINVLLLWSSFRWGLIAYGALILLHVLAFKPTLLRPKLYELFHALHGVLALVFFVACWLHYPPLMLWVAVAVGIWFVERLARAAWVMYCNRSQKEIFVQHMHLNGSISEKGSDLRDLSRGQSFFNIATAANSEYSLLQKSDNSHNYPPPLESQQSLRASGYGFEAHIQALPGKTMRVVIPVGRRIKSWVAGQHIWISFPHLPDRNGKRSLLGRLEWHPFTIASTPGTSLAWQHDDSNQDERLHGEKIVLIIRARAGLTDRLYSWTKSTLLKQASLVSGRREDIGSTAAKPQPARLKVLLEPTPHITRSHFEHHDVSFIICGGSGVTFGIAILGSLVEALKTEALSDVKDAHHRVGREKVGKDDNSDRKSRTRHVRFIWIIQDASHLSWVARPLQYFHSIVPDRWLTIEVYITQNAALEHFGFEARPTPAYMQDAAVRSSQDLARFEGEADCVVPSEIDLAKFQAGQPSSFSRIPERDSRPVKPLRNASEVTLHAVFQNQSSMSQPRASTMAPAFIRPSLSVTDSQNAGWQNLAGEIAARRGVSRNQESSQGATAGQSERSIRPLRSSQGHARTLSNSAHLSAPAATSRTLKDTNRYSANHSRSNSGHGFTLAAPFEQQPRSDQADFFLADTLRALNNSSSSFLNSPANSLRSPTSPRRKRTESSYALHSELSSETILPMTWDEAETLDNPASASLLSPRRSSAYTSQTGRQQPPSRLSSNASPTVVSPAVLEEQAAFFHMTNGRPDIDRLLSEILDTLRQLQSSSLGVITCGPTSLDAEVRHSVSQAMRTTSTSIDLIAQEHTW